MYKDTQSNFYLNNSIIAISDGLNDNFIKYATKYIYTLSLNPYTNPSEDNQDIKIAITRLKNGLCFVCDKTFSIHEFLTAPDKILEKCFGFVPFRPISISDFTKLTPNEFLSQNINNQHSLNSDHELNIEMIRDTLYGTYNSPDLYGSIMIRLINILSEYVFEYNHKVYNFNKYAYQYADENSSHKLMEEYELNRKITHIENNIKNKYSQDFIDSRVYALIAYCFDDFFSLNSYCDINNRRQQLNLETQDMILYSHTESQKFLTKNNPSIIM